MPDRGFGAQLVGSWGVAGERGSKRTFEGHEAGDSWLGGLQKRQKGKCGEQENFVMSRKEKKGVTNRRAR